MSEVARREAPVPVTMGARGVQLQSFDDAWRFANAVAKSTKFAPKDWGVEDVFIAVQYGMEVGLSPMQAIQSIAVINGKPSLYGDAPKAICQGHPSWRGMREWYEGKPYDDDFTAYCTVLRDGEPEVVSSFSVADAKRAQLWGKQGPWSQYPKRMLQWAAKRWALRDQFPDVLKGLLSADEALDIDPVEDAAPRQVKRYALAAPEQEARNRTLESEMETAFQSPEPTPAKARRARRAAAMEQPPPKPEPVQAPHPEEPVMREPGDDTEEVTQERAPAPPNKASLRERVLALKAKGIVINAWQGFDPNDMADMIRYEKLVDEAEARLQKGTP